MMNITGLFVWTLGSVIQVIQLISTLKNYLFRTFQSLWSWSRAITGFLQLLGSLVSLVFYLFLVSISFSYASQNPVTMGLRANASDKNLKQKSICHQTYKRFVWMAAPISYSMAWSVGSPKFICLCINFSHYLNQRISDTFFQTNSL